jgi:hypothetical protein
MVVQRAIFFLILAISAYFIYKSFVPETFAPGIAPTIHAQPSYGPASTVPSGPNPPSMNVPLQQRRAVMNPPVEAADPYMERHEDAYAPESLTYPERNFGPGIVPESTYIAEASGVANPYSMEGQQVQQYSPELVQNGGVFDGSIVAHEEPNYYGAI